MVCEFEWLTAAKPGSLLDDCEFAVLLAPFIHQIRFTSLLFFSHWTDVVIRSGAERTHQQVNDNRPGEKLYWEIKLFVPRMYTEGYILFTFKLA